MSEKDDVYELLDDLDHEGAKISLSFDLDASGDRIIYLTEPEGGLDQDLKDKIAENEKAILEYFGVDEGRILSSSGAPIVAVDIPPVVASIAGKQQPDGVRLSGYSLAPVVDSVVVEAVSETADYSFARKAELEFIGDGVWSFTGGFFDPLMIVHGKTIIPPDQWSINSELDSVELPIYIFPDDSVYAVGIIGNTTNTEHIRA